jgi:hypothetical protein
MRGVGVPNDSIECKLVGILCEDVVDDLAVAFVRLESIKLGDYCC